MSIPVAAPDASRSMLPPEGLAVLLSPLMYIYDPYQLTMYVVIGIATFILAFVLTNVLVMGNETIVTKVKIQH